MQELTARFFRTEVVLREGLNSELKDCSVFSHVFILWPQEKVLLLRILSAARFPEPSRPLCARCCVQKGVKAGPLQALHEV